MRDQQVGASREAARMASVRFREGEGQYLDILDAERSLYQAEATLATARTDHLLSVVEIHRALGGGWEICAGAGGPNCTRWRKPGFTVLYANAAGLDRKSGVSGKG